MSGCEGWAAVIDGQTLAALYHSSAHDLALSSGAQREDRVEPMWVKALAHREEVELLAAPLSNADLHDCGRSSAAADNCPRLHIRRGA